MGVQVPPRTRSYVHDRIRSRLRRYSFFLRMVGERQPDPPVEVGFVRWVGVFERLHDAPQLGYEVHDLLLGHAAAGWLLEPRFRQSAPGLSLFYPARDEHRLNYLTIAEIAGRWGFR